VSTPLSNFIKSDSKTILIRAFSNSSTTSRTHTINYLNVQPVYDSVYSPSAFTQITGGTVSTSYINTVNAL